MTAREHPPEHRAWFEQMPEGAAAALTDGQLASWPPAEAWQRLLALADDLDLRAWGYGSALARRLYPHPDSRLSGGPPPSDAQLALDASTTRDTLRKGKRLLVARGWLEAEERQGEAGHVRMLVPPSYVRTDGLLSEERATRGECRITRPPDEQFVRSMKGVEMPEADEGVARVDPEPGEQVVTHLTNRSSPQKGEATPELALTAVEEEREGLACARARAAVDAQGNAYVPPRHETEEEREQRRALWNADYWESRGF